MTQNTSSAVMQQRTEAHDSLDDFPTQPWATRALIEHVLRPRGHATKTQRCWEPACNRGHMVRPLREYFGRVIASDIFDYGLLGQDARNLDFLLPYSDGIFAMKGGVDWVITNPPFRLAQQFVERAWHLPHIKGVAVIVRTSFLEGVNRYEELYRHNAPSIVAQFSERVPMVKGRLTATGSTATSYCWLVWLKDDDSGETRLVWIPPCRRALERPGDYPNVP